MKHAFGGNVRWISPVVVVLGLLLAGCSAPANEGSLDSSTVQSSIEPTVPVVEPAVAPPRALTWKSSCMLSQDEVTAAMQYLGWAGTGATEPLNDDTSLTECDYPETGDSTRSVGVDFRLYRDGADYGWVTPSSSTVTFTAPDPVTGAANACTSATSGKSPAGYEGICTAVGGVPAVLDPERLAVVIFPAGKSFYVIQLLGISGTEKETEPLLALATLLSTRDLVAE